MFRLKALVILMCFLFIETVSVRAEEDAIDPVSVSPGMYMIVLENELVRVVEYEIPAGKRDNWHTHPAKVSYVVSGGALKITTEAGESFLVDEETGAVSWFDAVGKHYAENVGKTAVKIILVEIKAAATAPEDINNYRRD